MKSAASRIVQKQRCMYMAQDMLTTFKDDPEDEKAITNHGCNRMAMIWKPKPNHSYGSVQKRQDRKKHIKFCQM